MTTPTRLLQFYYAAGWQPIPVPRGEKGPRIPGWQAKTFTAADFNLSDNIGLKLGVPSGDLVDVDIDSLEALRVAPLFLPKTPLVHGRASKPRSHYYYHAPGITTRQFKDTDGTMLVELRSTGAQTVVPPSVHGSGEVIEWDGDVTQLAPAAVSPEVLVPHVAYLATATIFGRHWPAGARHEAAGLVAGFLYTLGVTHPVVMEHIITAICTIAGDEEPADRIRYARDTLTRAEQGQAVGGGPKLSDAVGADVVKRVRSWFHTKTSWLEEWTEQGIGLMAGRSARVLVPFDATRYELMDLAAFHAWCDGKVQVGVNTRTGDPVEVKKSRVWMEWEGKLKYLGFQLSTNGHVTPGYYNLWRGFSREPKRGGWPHLRRHLLEVICGGSPEIFHYLMCWLADLVQSPDRPAQVAVAMRGGQGTGKSVVGDSLVRLFGPHGVTLNAPRQLVGHFNAHLRDKVLVFADEAYWAGDRSALGTLKRIITERTIVIEQKGQDAYTTANVMHLLLASNEEWVVPAGVDERRFLVVDVDSRHRGDRAYFDRLFDEVDGDGLAAMLYDLLEWHIDINLRDVPQTTALHEQKLLTAGSLARWWFEVLTDGTLCWQTPTTHPTLGACYQVDRDTVYHHYLSTVSHTRERDHRLVTEVGAALKRELLPRGWPVARQVYGGKRVWLFPSLSECRVHFTRQHKAQLSDFGWDREELPLDDSADATPF